MALFLFRCSYLWAAIVFSSAYHHSFNNDRQSVIDALINESLRSHNVTGCDGEKVTLHCPRNTHILVEAGFYGRVVPESILCPSRQPDRKSMGYDSSCDVIQAQSKLSEICDKKRKCNIYVDTSTFEEDPCPSTSKYLQMNYKCKPVSYDSESFCANTEMHLECREGRRLAIYSATYGRLANSDNGHCSSKSSPAPEKECLRDVLPAVVDLCHAQESCTLHVSDRSFKSPCSKNITAHLNILFMCLNEEIFSEEAINGELQTLIEYKKYFTEGSGNSEKEREDEQDELDEEEFDEDDIEKADIGSEKIVIDWEKIEHDSDEMVKEDVPIHEDFKESSVIENTEKKIHEMNNDAGYDSDEIKFKKLPEDEPLSASKDEELMSANFIGIMHDLFLVGSYLKENKEKVLLCLALALVSSLILIVMACIIQKCTSGKKGKEIHRRPKRVRYSIERSQLIEKGNPYSMLGGPLSLPEMGDTENETFFRYSISTPPRSSHYDF